VVGLVWSNGPESYTGSSAAAGRVSHAGQVKVSGWGKANDLTSIKKKLIVEKPNKGCQMNNTGKRSGKTSCIVRK
jgi:predicted DNA-binding WGR domain protein